MLMQKNDLFLSSYNGLCWQMAKSCQISVVSQLSLAMGLVGFYFRVGTVVFIFILYEDELWEKLLRVRTQNRDAQIRLK